MTSARLEPMLARLALPTESDRTALGGTSAALGVAQRWSFQQLGAIQGVRVAVDADLTNLNELANLLSAKGLNPSALSLAEQLAWLYRLEGPHFVVRLQGAFALAVWDEVTHRAILAIDRFGLKSLYWSQEADRLVFASGLAAVQTAEDRPGEINPVAVMQFLLFSVVPAPLAIYRGVEKLRPGFFLTYDKDRVSQQRYWDLDYSESESTDVREWALKLREGLRSAVHRHLDGCEAPSTGAYLSGGTDSSSVVAFMAERCSPVNTFSIAFAEAHYDEIGFARTTAERFRTRHYERRLSPRDAAEVITKIAGYYDEPFANSSAIGAYYCALLARENGVDTLLAGDGGDELFAGNERYASDKYFALYQAVPEWIRRGVLEPVARLLPEQDGWLSRPRRYIRRANIPNPRRIFSYGLFFSADPEEVFDPEFLSQAPPERWMDIADAHFHTARATSEVNRLMYLDLKLTLADNDLRKVSGTAELAGVRVRYPLLDSQLAELSGRIPSRLKLKGFEMRYIFKQAMKGILPDRVLYKKKHGFGVPLGLWSLQDSRLNAMVQDILRDSRTRQRGYFRKEFLDHLLDRHRQEHAAYYGEFVWYLLALELWHRQHLECDQRSACVN